MSKVKMYQIPSDYLYPLHMVRPRFKNNLENVLLYMAKEISDFGKSIDRDALDAIIAQFPGNDTLKEKTLANWRTEISALFALRQYDSEYGFYPSNIANRLSETEDLIEFFKNFVLKMQFPCGMLKAHVNKELIEKNIRFKPYDFILSLLSILNDESVTESYITKDELTYVIFDDVRFTSGALKPKDAAQVIIRNRRENAEYESYPFIKGVTKESRGDQTRTALDFLDYMDFSNVLIKKGSKYFINNTDKSFINYSMEKNDFYDAYDKFYGKTFSVADLSKIENFWFDYANTLDFEKSKTKIGKLITSRDDVEDVSFELKDAKKTTISTKEIGDMGEAIVIAHEKKKLESLGLGHNCHLVKFIPTHLAAGYDVKSMDEMDNQIFIEVKTTISNHPVTQNRISLTKNEWNAAYTSGSNYYIYRLIINNDSRKLLIMNDPVRLVQTGEIKLAAPHGVELIFKAGLMDEVEILS